MLWMNKERMLEGYRYEEAKQLLMAGDSDKAISLLVNAASLGHVSSMVELGDILTSNIGCHDYCPYSYEDGIDWYRIAASCNNQKAIARMKELTGSKFTPKNVYRKYLLIHLFSSLGYFFPAAVLFSRGANLLGCIIVPFTLQAITVGFYMLSHLFEMGNLNIPHFVVMDPFRSYVRENNITVLTITIGLLASILYSVLQLARDTRGISGVSILLLILSWAVVGMIIRLLFILVLIKRKDTFSLGRSMGLLERVGLIKDSKWIKGAQGAVWVSIVGLLITGLLLVTVQAKA